MEPPGLKYFVANQHGFVLVTIAGSIDKDTLSILVKIREEIAQIKIADFQIRFGTCCRSDPLFSAFNKSAVGSKVS